MAGYTCSLVNVSVQALSKLDLEYLECTDVYTRKYISMCSPDARLFMKKALQQHKRREKSGEDRRQVQKRRRGWGRAMTADSAVNPFGASPHYQNASNVYLSPLVPARDFLHRLTAFTCSYPNIAQT